MVSRPFLSQGGILAAAFASSVRNKKDVLLQNTLDSSTRCGVDEQMFNRICMVYSQGGAGTRVSAWVPWLSGEWNP
jgi:hypothetical protein